MADSLAGPLVGVISGLIFCVLYVRRLSRSTSRSFKSETTRQRVLKHEEANHVAEILFLVGFALPLIWFRTSLMSGDWRPVAMGYGIACGLVIATLVVLAFRSKCSPRETMLAFSNEKDMPFALMLFLLLFGIGSFIFAAVAFATDA